MVGSAEGPRGLRKRERKESAFSPLSERLVQARDDGARRNEKKDNAKSYKGKGYEGKFRPKLGKHICSNNNANCVSARD